MDEDNKAFVTIATNDNYAMGALVLGYSLRRVETKHKLVVLLTPEVTSPVRLKLEQVFDEVQNVDLLDSKDDVHLSLMERPELGSTFTKLHIWKLHQYSKCVFLDADTLVCKNCDELFEREELSAAPDIGWPDCFNSGVFVFIPSLETFENLLKLAIEQGSFDGYMPDQACKFLKIFLALVGRLGRAWVELKVWPPPRGGDQGLLNTYFSDWATQDIRKHLSFIYNMVTSSSYTYIPAYKYFGHRVKIAHFLGAMKPWMHDHRNDQNGFEPCTQCLSSAEFYKLWWEIYTESIVDSSLIEETCEEVSNLVLVSSPDYSPSVPSSEDRKTSWEQGQIDYLGADSFDNIQRKLEESINSKK